RDFHVTGVQTCALPISWEWEGTAAELLALLNERVDEQTARRKEWPTTPRALSGRIRRAAPLLRYAGVDVQLDQREPGTGKRLIVLKKIIDDNRHDRHDRHEHDNNGLPARDGTVTQNMPTVTTVTQPSREKSAPRAGLDDSDGRDGINPSYSSSLDGEGDDPW